MEKIGDVSGHIQSHGYGHGSGLADGLVLPKAPGIKKGKKK